MASSERAQVDPEDIRDANGTVRTELEMWSRANGPVTYNKWQSVYFALLREHGLQDDEVQENESMGDKQKRIRDLYRVIQGAVHGPDHLALAMQRRKVGAEIESGREHAPFAQIANGPENRAETAPPAGREGPGRETALDRPVRPAEEYAVFTPRGS